MCLLSGAHIRNRARLHLAGTGDFALNRIDLLPDPCPFPDNTLAKKKRTLVEKEKTIYAPFSGVGGIVYDRDAVYVDLGGSHGGGGGGHQDDEGATATVNNALVANMMDSVEVAVDEKIQESELQLFTGSAPIKASEVEVNGERHRRKVVFSDDDDEEGESSGGSSSSSSEEETEAAEEQDSELMVDRDKALLRAMGEDVSSDEDFDVNKAKQKVIKPKNRAKKGKSSENTFKTKSPIDDSGHESNESKVKMLYLYCFFTLIHQILVFLCLSYNSTLPLELVSDSAIVVMMMFKSVATSASPPIVSEIVGFSTSKKM